MMFLINFFVSPCSPEYGPWEGGTNITIRGVNLGKNFEDIARGVTVAGMACDPYPHLYEKTEKIVCKVNFEIIVMIDVLETRQLTDG